VPSKKEFERLSQDNYRLQKEATEQAQEILRCWDAVKFTAVAVNADKKDRLVEGDKLDVSCTVDLGQAQPGIFSVELFYMVDGKSRFKVIPMQLHARERTLAHYGCSFVTQGSGLQNINVRMRSANQIVQDMHPQLVRWAE
jgi:phosphotransacetylase